MKKVTIIKDSTLVIVTIFTYFIFVTSAHDIGKLNDSYIKFL